MQITYSEKRGAYEAKRDMGNDITVSVYGKTIADAIAEGVRVTR